MLFTSAIKDLTFNALFSSILQIFSVFGVINAIVKFGGRLMVMIEL